MKNLMNKTLRAEALATVAVAGLMCATILARAAVHLPHPPKITKTTIYAPHRIWGRRRIPDVEQRPSGTKRRRRALKAARRYARLVEVRIQSRATAGWQRLCPGPRYGLHHPDAGATNQYAGATNQYPGATNQYAGATNRSAGATNQYAVPPTPTLELCIVSAGVTQDATTVTGTSGADTIDCSMVNSGRTINGFDGDDTITGTQFDDMINGGEGNNTITALNGDNIITSGAGNDTITAGPEGNNNINSGAGNDTITSGTGNDTIDAGDGNNTVTSGTGNDTITSGAATTPSHSLPTVPTSSTTAPVPTSVTLLPVRSPTPSRTWATVTTPSPPKRSRGSNLSIHEVGAPVRKTI